MSIEFALAILVGVLMPCVGGLLAFSLRLERRLVRLEIFMREVNRETNAFDPASLESHR